MDWTIIAEMNMVEYLCFRAKSSESIGLNTRRFPRPARTRLDVSTTKSGQVPEGMKSVNLHKFPLNIVKVKIDQ